MTKKELIKIAEKYGMDWITNPVTRQKFGVYLQTNQEIPELDSIADSKELHAVTVERTYGPRDVDGITYRVFCPTDWMDLYGWVE